MLILSKRLCEYISQIFVHVYGGVVYYSAFVQISTIVVTNVDVLGASLYESSGDESESSLIVAVDWQRW
jgi:hypothetical protein